jgi:hypothetical protein
VAVAGVIRLSTDDGGTTADVTSGLDEADETDGADRADDAVAPPSTTAGPPAADTVSGSESSVSTVSYGGADWVLPWGDGFVSFGQVTDS